MECGDLSDLDTYIRWLGGVVIVVDELDEHPTSATPAAMTHNREKRTKKNPLFTTDAGIDT
jgi:hypothetical protein